MDVWNSFLFGRYVDYRGGKEEVFKDKIGEIGRCFYIEGSWILFSKLWGFTGVIEIRGSKGLDFNIRKVVLEVEW